MGDLPFFKDNETPKGGVVWIYDNDICDFVEDVQKALAEIGTVAADRERCDFLFEKVE